MTTIRRIVPNIPSNKLEESKKFYRDFLGMRLAMDMQWVLTFVSESNPTAQVTLVKSDDAAPLQFNITLSIEAADLNALYDKAKAFNYEIAYEIKDEPWGVRRFWVKDPNGVTINLMTHTKE
jgi:predicted enzyme related to lactoylglutathione lyase